MTWRAKAYLAVLILRHAGVGFACLFLPDTFKSTSYDVLIQMAPLPVWGVMFTITGLQAAIALAFDNDRHARYVLIGSSTITAAWATAFVVAGARGLLLGPTGPIMWSALTLKDLIVSGMPLRSPLEKVVREQRLV